MSLLEFELRSVISECARRTNEECNVLEARGSCEEWRDTSCICEDGECMESGEAFVDGEERAERMGCIGEACMYDVMNDEESTCGCGWWACSISGGVYVIFGGAGGCCCGRCPDVYVRSCMSVIPARISILVKGEMG